MSILSVTMGFIDVTSQLAVSDLAGPAEEALKVGEREPAEKMKVIDVAQIRRASDSWSWTRTPQPTPPACAQK